MTTEKELWRDKAVCKGIDPNVFIPNEGRGLNGRTTYTRARAFCAVCPVRIECLMYALTANIEFGMYGGTTPRERRRMKPTMMNLTTGE